MDPRDGTEEEIACTGAFIAIGHKPITTFLDGQIETDDEGYILHKEHTMTSVPVFAAGDVVDTRYRQAITAAGMGCQRRHRCRRWLEYNMTEHADRPSRGVDEVRHARHLRLDDVGREGKLGLVRHPLRSSARGLGCPAAVLPQPVLVG